MLTTAVLHLPEPRTPLYPLIEQRLAEASRPLVERLQAWRMMGDEIGLNTTDFHGKPVLYRGVKFEGGPREVFWSHFFEPFIVAAERQTLEWVIDCCHKRNLESDKYVAEAKSLLGLLAEGVYEDMARIDQILRGGGYPHSVTLVDVSPKIKAMKGQLDDLAVALTHSNKLAPSQPPGKEVLQLKPTFWGCSIDLKALWRYCFKKSI